MIEATLPTGHNIINEICIRNKGEFALNQITVKWVLFISMEVFYSHQVNVKTSATRFVGLHCMNKELTG